jgi:hypothetical protein
MRVIALAMPWAKPGVRTVPLLERPADSANLMIHRAKYLPRQMTLEGSLLARLDRLASATRRDVLKKTACQGSPHARRRQL